MGNEIGAGICDGCGHDVEHLIAIDGAPLAGGALCRTCLPEAKLIPAPQGPAMLRAAMWRFKEERGCAVTELRVARPGFIDLCRIVGPMWPHVPVRLDAQVRAGHVVLVGC